MGGDPGTPSGRLEMIEGAVAMTQLQAAHQTSAGSTNALYGGKGTPVSYTHLTLPTNREV